VPTDSQSPWVLVPSPVREAFDRMLTRPDGGPYRFLGEFRTFRPQRGIVTGANDVFVISSLATTADDDQEIIAHSEGYHQRSGDIRQRFVSRVEKDIVRPLVRGANIDPWNVKISDFIFWTHDENTGEVRFTLPRRATEYFERHRSQLERRDDYRTDRHEEKPIWKLYRVATAKLGAKVLIQKIATELEACYAPAFANVPILGNQLLIPLQTAYFIPVVNELQGFAVAALLNSLPLRVYTASFSDRARGAYVHFISWVLGLIPVPLAISDLLDDNRASERIQRLIGISRALHLNPEIPERPALEMEVDRIVAQLYHLTDAQLDSLRDWYNFATPSEPGDALIPDDEEDDRDEA
jgi:hypothetical protein